MFTRRTGNGFPCSLTAVCGVHGAAGATPFGVEVQQLDLRRGSGGQGEERPRRRATRSWVPSRVAFRVLWFAVGSHPCEPHARTKGLAGSVFSFPVGAGLWWVPHCLRPRQNLQAQLGDFFPRIPSGDPGVAADFSSHAERGPPGPSIVRLCCCPVRLIIDCFRRRRA